MSVYLQINTLYIVFIQHQFFYSLVISSLSHSDFVKSIETTLIVILICIGYSSNCYKLYHLSRYIFGVLLGLMRGPQVEELPPEPTEEEKIGQLRHRLLQQTSKTEYTISTRCGCFGNWIFLITVTVSLLSFNDLDLGQHFCIEPGWKVLLDELHQKIFGLEAECSKISFFKVVLRKMYHNRRNI